MNRASVGSTDVTRLPVSAPGMRIGLFGGSFNPPHEGHRLVAMQALKRLQLDAVWLLVTPGNPLKDNARLPPLADRVWAARDLVRHPRIKVTGFEAEHGFRYTYDTLRYLIATHPGRRFVWIMGADNLVGFHRWEHWRDIAALMPIAVYVRPGSARRAPISKAAKTLADGRIDETDAPLLAGMRPPAWVFLHGMMSGLSSTALRGAREATSDGRQA